jgi:hypothetical protein
MVFVNSMSDLFQDAIPDEYIDSVATIMLRADWHTYQVLTKRADRLEQLLKTTLRHAANARHIWWGVSVEDKKYGLPRIEHLRRAPASVRFLSIEPLLEDLGRLNLSRIDWAIVGGESGHGARPMQPAWVSAIKQACEAHGTKFFFKQWGGVNKARTGRLLNGRTYDDMPPRIKPPVRTRDERQKLQEELAAIAKPWRTTPLIQLRRAQRGTLGRAQPQDGVPRIPQEYPTKFQNVVLKSINDEACETD